MIIADAIHYNGVDADKVFLGADLIWEKTLTPPTPVFGPNTLAGKFVDNSTASDWQWWPNGKSGRTGVSISDKVDPKTKEFCFDYETPLTSCKYLFNGNGSYNRYERIDHIPDTSQVTDMSYMFANGSVYLQSIDLSDIDTSQVTNIASMFNNCKALTSLDLSGFDTSKVGIMVATFSGCGRLVLLNLSGFNFDKIYCLLYTFDGTYALTTVIGPIYNVGGLPDLVSSPLTNESAMVFINGLSDYSSISISSSITFRQVTYDTLTPEQIAVATSKGWDVIRGRE